MKLSEYLCKRREVEHDVFLSRKAQELADALLKENAESGGSKYPTVASMWDEIIHRAKKLEEENG